MKSRLMISCTALAVCTACAHLGERELPSPTPRAAEINRAMDAAVIPHIDLRRVPAGTAVQAWSEANRSAHPQPFAVRYIIVRPTTFTAGTATPATALQKEPTVTVRRKNVTSKRLLNEICQQANWFWTVRGETIFIGPRGSFPKPQP